MSTSIRLSSIFVLEQDAALDFYVGVLGMEVHTDIDHRFMRWLTISGGGPDTGGSSGTPGPAVDG